MSRPARNSQRHRSREAALQMLYQWEVSGAGPDDVTASYWQAHAPEPPFTAEGRALAERLLCGTIAHCAAIDPLLAEAAANWRLERMAILDRLVLRLAVFELQHEPDTPPAVVINEAIELARRYSGEEAVPFVNGVLDSVRKSLEARAPQRS